MSWDAGSPLPTNIIKHQLCDENCHLVLSYFVISTKNVIIDIGSNTHFVAFVLFLVSSLLKLLPSQVELLCCYFLVFPTSTSRFFRAVRFGLIIVSDEQMDCK